MNIILIIIIAALTININSNKLFSKINKPNAKSKSNTGNCVNPNGEAVSWYVIYTLQNSFGKYVYHDESMKTFQSFPTDEQSFPPLNIVKGLNDKSNNHLVWNDDSIAEDTVKQNIRFSTIAHSKGVFLTKNKEESVLLIHSLPRFPTLQLDETFKEGFTGNWGVYVQTWLCISLDEENSLKVLDALSQLPPPIQFSRITNEKASSISILLESIVEGKTEDREDKTVLIKSKNSNFEFTYFVKTKNEEVDLPYEKTIPTYFNSSIFVGTWSKPKLFDAFCNENHYNSLSILEFNVLGMKYTSNQDHSKWAVTEKDTAFCIGDLNRTASQLKRSGGVMCIKNSLLSRLVKQFIVVTQEC